MMSGSAFAMESAHPAHDPARRIHERDHFRVLYRRRASDVDLYRRPGSAVAAWAEAEYGPQAIRSKISSKSSGSLDFPVQESGGTIASSTSASGTLRSLSPNIADLVFIKPELLEAARSSLRKQGFIEAILTNAADEEAQAEDDETAALA